MSLAWPRDTYRFNVTVDDASLVHILYRLKHLQKNVEGNGFCKLTPKLLFETRNTLPLQFHHDKALFVEVFLAHEVEHRHNTD